MKLTIFAIIFALVLSSCIEHKKFYIKTVDIDKSTRLNWYYYSYISNFSRDFVEIEKEGHGKVIFEAKQLTDIAFNQDTIKFQIEGLSYRQSHVLYDTIDTYTIKSLGYKYTIDTTGPFWNCKDNRRGRLGQFDLSKPHNRNLDGN